MFESGKPGLRTRVPWFFNQAWTRVKPWFYQALGARAVFELGQRPMQQIGFFNELVERKILLPKV